MRLKVSRSKNSASYYVTKTIYDNCAEKTITVEKLGTEKYLLKKLNGEDPHTWAKAYVKELNKICKAITDKYKFPFDLNEIFSQLLYGRILFPSSKKAATQLCANFLEPPSFELHQVYRALDALTKEADLIQAQLYKNSLALCDRNTSVLYYDCTKFYFEIEEEDGLKQYGKGKENRPNPIVSMGLFMDGNGIPLAFCIDPGNTNEQGTLKPLEKKILKDFELSKFVVCTDAGLSSTANRRFNSINDRAFITTQSIKKLKAHLKKWALDPTGWKLDSKDKNAAQKTYRLDQVKAFYAGKERTQEEHTALADKVFYKERWVNEDDLEQRMIVTFSLKYRYYQQRIRNGQIERAAKTITDNPTTLKKYNAHDYRRFVKKDHCTLDGEKAEKEILSIDQEVIRTEEIYDGFYAVCTSLEDDVKAIVKANQKRWEIEECFRIIKVNAKQDQYTSKETNVSLRTS